MRRYLEGTEMQKQRDFSPAVITPGGHMVWLADHTTTQDDKAEISRTMLWRRFASLVDISND